MRQIILAAALLWAGTACAQQTTVYGTDGRVVGRAVTDSQGSTTLYDSKGSVIGRTSTDSQGTTTIRDAGGRKAGSFTK